jgi:hypothetical protein
MSRATATAVFAALLAWPLLIDAAPRTVGSAAPRAERPDKPTGPIMVEHRLAAEPAVGVPLKTRRRRRRPAQHRSHRDGTSRSVRVAAIAGSRRRRSVLVGDHRRAAGGGSQLLERHCLGLDRRGRSSAQRHDRSPQHRGTASGPRHACRRREADRTTGRGKPLERYRKREFSHGGLRRTVLILRSQLWPART